jgi:hypothetical protein
MAKFQQRSGKLCGVIRMTGRFGDSLDWKLTIDFNLWTLFLNSSTFILSLYYCQTLLHLRHGGLSPPESILIMSVRSFLLRFNLRMR